MTNKITYTVQTTNTTKPVEYWNPYTNQYQDDNPLTGIPDGTYSGFKARLKGSSPEIKAVYSGSITLTSTTNTVNEYVLVLDVQGDDEVIITDATVG